MALASGIDPPDLVRLTDVRGDGLRVASDPIAHAVA